MAIGYADERKISGSGGTLLRDVKPRDRLWVFYPQLLLLNVLMLPALVGDITNGYVE